MFAEGKVHFPYTNVMGFEKGDNGEIAVNQEEAKTVRYIFQQALLGKTPYSIAKDLTQQGILSPSGKNHWSSVTIKRMLRNEKYKGDALLQKTYTIDFLSKKKNINKGELPQYYVENNHEAIVDKETFDAVQAALDRKEKGKGSTTLFSSKLVCGDCGHYFGSKVWHSTSKYRRVIYQCNEKYKGEKKCTTPHVTEDEIKDWFVAAINKVISNKDEIIQNLEMLLDAEKSSDLERRLGDLETEVEVVTQMISTLVKENAIMPQDQDVYQKKYSNLVERHDALVIEIESIEKQLLEAARHQKGLKEFLGTLNQQSELISEFDDMLWETMVDKVEISHNRIVTFTLKNGSEVVV